MKSFIFSLVGFLSASSFGGDVYRCAEKASDAIAANRLQYMVVLKELEDVRPVPEGFDYARHTEVSILSRDPQAGGRFTLDRSPFRTISKYEDVNLITEEKSRGFSLHIYLDEFDQASLKIKGVKKSMRVTCSRNDEI